LKCNPRQAADVPGIKLSCVYILTVCGCYEYCDW